MLDRKDVITGDKYMLDGKVVIVERIIDTVKGEAVSLLSGVPEGVNPISQNALKYWAGYTPMLRFQKAAKVLEE